MTTSARPPDGSRSPSAVRSTVAPISRRSWRRDRSGNRHATSGVGTPVAGDGGVMTRHYVAGELSVLLSRLQTVTTNEASAREVARLRYEAETTPLPALPAVTVRALELMDCLCWDSLACADTASFDRQATVGAELHEFGVCAGLLDDDVAAETLIRRHSTGGRTDGSRARHAGLGGADRRPLAGGGVLLPAGDVHRPGQRRRPGASSNGSARTASRSASRSTPTCSPGTPTGTRRSTPAIRRSGSGSSVVGSTPRTTASIGTLPPTPTRRR